MECRSSIEIDCLVVGSIKWVEIEALPEESCRNLEKVVFKGLTGTAFQLLSLLNLLPKAHNFSLIRVELEGLLYMLLAKVCLPIVQ